GASVLAFGSDEFVHHGLDLAHRVADRCSTSWRTEQLAHLVHALLEHRQPLADHVQGIEDHPVDTGEIVGDLLLPGQARIHRCIHWLGMLVGDHCWSADDAAQYSSMRPSTTVAPITGKWSRPTILKLIGMSRSVFIGSSRSVLPSHTKKSSTVMDPPEP